jgi:hypothetical protein
MTAQRGLAIVFLPGILTAILTMSGMTAAARVAQEQDRKASISGAVMFAVSRKPVAGAQVELSRIERVPSPIAALGQRVTKLRTETADDAGRFAFSGLEPGEYQLAPAPPENLNGQLFARPGPKRVTLAATGESQKLELWLTRASKITGRILDPDGKPGRGFRVALARVIWDGGLRLDGVPGAVPAIADENGDYTVLAPPGKDYLVTAQRPPGATAPSSLPQYPYYYPGVAHPEDAIRFSVREGADISGLNVSFDRTERFRVRFRLSVPERLPGVPDPLLSYLTGTARPIDAYLEPLGRGLIRTRSYDLALESLDGDIWLTPPLDSGDYELRVNYSAALANALRAKGFGDLDWDTLNPISQLRVTVDAREDSDGDHILDLGSAPISAKVSLPGRIIVEGVRAAEVDLTRLQIFFLDTMSSGASIRPAADGTFTLRGLHPGLYRMSPPPAAWVMPARFYVASVNAGDDVLRDGLRVNGGAPSSIDIVIADGAGRIEGVVRNRLGAIVPDARVVLAPPANRRGRLTSFPTALANGSGGFVIDRIPPGDYRLLALDNAGVPDTTALGNAVRHWEGPDFLREFENRGTPITVAPRARMTVDAVAVGIHD